MYICLCKGLTAAQVRQTARDGISDAESLVEALGLDDSECCGRCAANAPRILKWAVSDRGRLLVD